MLRVLQLRKMKVSMLNNGISFTFNLCISITHQ
jgi:hypothetical protein